ncbi:MAG: TonB-dependent receptor [Acidobacteriia bacterium]|nr:TonB-dependent receptor [Terriglobia bacterium]
MKKFSVVLCALALLAFSCTLFAPQAAAQAVFGSIFGTVTDPSGAAVPGAKVTVTSATKGTSQETTTNADGNYSVTHLIPDVYNVRAEGAGFKAFEAKGIVVSADAAARVDGQFQVGGSTETVEVTAESPQLKTDRADVATIFNDKAVEDLPLFNRNFTALVLASPGAQQLGWSHASSENPQGSLQTKVNGQTFAGTGFMLDGTDNRDPILGIIVINPTLESVTEAKMTSQNYDAEFGQAIAGVVASQTKSGTNSLHGSVFGFRRSDATQARDPFSQSPSKANPVTGRTIPPILYGQYGAAVGGPIIKDKLFFFGDYQATRSKIGSSFLQSIPSTLVRSTCGVAGVTNCDLSEYANQIYDPASGAITDPTDPAYATDRTPFVGNLIPNSRLSPQAVALLQQFPNPTNTGLLNNFAAGGNGVFNNDQFNIRIDDQTTSKLHTFGRYSFANYTLTGVGAFGDLGGNGFGTGGFAGASKSRDQSIAGGFDYAFRPSVLTDFRFGYVRYHVNVVPNGVGTTPASDVGIPGLNTGTDFTSGQPSYFVGSSGGDGTDTGAISTTGGVSNFGYGLGVNRCNCPLIEQEDQFQFVNNWTKITGNHQIKFGADIRYARNLRVPSDNHRAGELSFARERTSLAGSASPTGVALATFLLGDVTTFKRYVSTSTNAAERQKRFYFYGQDTWRATSKLTIAFGLRWDIMNPEYVNGDANGSLLDLNTGLLRVGGVGDVGRNFNIERNWNNFGPRLGIAYQLAPKTVLRMGYGRSYDIGVFGSIFGHAVTQNLPVLAVQNLNPTTQTADVFNLSVGPTAPVFPTVPSNGLLPLPDGIFARARPTRMRLARLDAYNFTVQHQLTNTISAELAFVGNNGHGFYANNPAAGANQPTVVGFGPGGPSKNERRPFFARYGWTQDIDFFGNDAPSYYDALQAKLDKRFNNGLQFVAHYTWSKNLSHDGAYYNIDPQVQYGPDDFNRKHVFSISTVYELPFGRGKQFMGNANRALNLLIGGFQLNTTTNWSSGLPWSASYNECNSDQDVGICRPILIGSLHTSVGHFDPVAGSVPFFTPVAPMPLNGDTSGPFQRPGLAQFGSGRNAFTGPSFFNSDFSLFKNFAITERVGAQFRFEAFNVFNHVNLNNPNNCIDCSGSGLITSLAPNAQMRQLNFGMKVTF